MNSSCIRFDCKLAPCKNKSLGLHPFLFEFPAGKNVPAMHFFACSATGITPILCGVYGETDEAVSLSGRLCLCWGAGRKGLFKCPPCCSTVIPYTTTPWRSFFIQRQINGAFWTGMILLLENNFYAFPRFQDCRTLLVNV